MNIFIYYGVIMGSDSKKDKKRKAHLVPFEVVFPEFYGEEVDKEWEKDKQKPQVPVEKRKKPKASFRWKQ